MTSVLIKKGNLENAHTQGECNVKMKAESGVMLLQAKECRRLPGNHQKVGERHGTDDPSQTSEGTNNANTLISNFYSLKRRQRISVV